MHNEFINTAAHSIYEEATKVINEIITGSKTSAVAIGLYLNLPIKVELRKLPTDLTIKPKLSNLAENVSAYLAHDDKTKVIFAFYYSDDKQIPKLTKLLSEDKAGLYFAYLYIREVMRVAQNHNTFAHYSMLRPILEKTNLDPEKYLFYINAASHYALNIFIKSIFDTTYTSASIRSSDKANKYKWTQTIFGHQFYTPAYAEMTIPEILKEVVAQHTIGEAFEGGFYSNGIPFADHVCVNDKYDEHITDVGESLTDTLKTFGKGAATQQIFESGFKAVKVKTGWFNKFKSLFNRTVYYKTENFSSTWSSLNSTYRHKFKSPAKKFEDKSLSIVMSIDQSGSQSDEALGKILHVIQKKANKIADITILIHDTEIKASGHYKGSELASNPDIMHLLSNRICNGGTSHYHVIKHVVDGIADKSIDPAKTIFISYSDNMSDIPDVMAKFPQMKQIERVWVCDIDNPLPDSCGGTNITLI